WMRGHLREGQRLVEGALERSGDIRSSARGTALHGGAILTAVQGDLVRAFDLFRESVAVLRGIGDAVGLIRPLGDLATTHSFTGDAAGAEAMVEEDLRLAREAGDPWGIAYALHMTAQVALPQGQFARAASFSEEAAEIWRHVCVKRTLALDTVHLVHYI